MRWPRCSSSFNFTIGPQEVFQNNVLLPFPHRKQYRLKRLLPPVRDVLLSLFGRIITPQSAFRIPQLAAGYNLRTEFTFGHFFTILIYPGDKKHHEINMLNFSSNGTKIAQTLWLVAEATHKNLQGQFVLHKNAREDSNETTR